MSHFIELNAMIDKRFIFSDNYKSAIIEKTMIDMKRTVKTLQQITFFEKKTQNKRTEKEMNALDIAIQDEFLKNKSDESQESKTATFKNE